jgi:SAM-dependent methyltransferase
MPADIDLAKPSAARAYDYYLDGSHNWKVDRDFGDRVLSRAPAVRDFALENRAFLRRAVTWLAEQGIDRFLDIGSGIPTVGNVHEIAQRVNPRAHTVYVDYEHIAVAHAAQILDAEDPRRERTDVIRADLRDPESVLEHPTTRRLLDFDRPVALLMVAVLHFVAPADGVDEIMARYRGRLTPGSFLAISHFTREGIPAEMQQQASALEELYADTPNPGYFRDHAEFTALFTGFEMVSPGAVWLSEWQPDRAFEGDPSRTMVLSAVGRKG